MPPRNTSPAPETPPALPAYIPHNPDWTPEQREEAMRLGLQNAELKAALIADTLRKEKAILEDYKRLKPAVDEARQKLASLMETFDRAIELKGERDAKIEEYCRAVADQGKWGAFSPADFVEATHLPELKEVRPKVEATLRRVIVTKAEEALAKFIEKNREVLIRWKALE